MGRPKKKIQENKRFEDCIDIINSCINKRKHRWMLGALNYIDFEDVAQNLRFHIFKKWNLYDQKKKLESWLTVVINNQMINMVRNLYNNYKKPCIDCVFYGGGDICEKFGQVSVSCDLFRTWTYGKKSKHDIQLALPMENHQNEVFEMKNEALDIERSTTNLHERMKQILKPLEYSVFYNLFILHKSEEEVAKMLNFKSKEKNRAAGYGRISQIKKEIIRKAKENINNGEIEIICN